MLPRLVNNSFLGGADMIISSTEQLKNTLFSTINSLLDRRDVFLRNPKSNFTRTKKISFEQTILFPMLAGQGNITSELMDFFDEKRLPLPSAMIQRRNHVKPEGFKALFSEFTDKLPVKKTYHGYRLIACDGSRLNLPYNSSDKNSFSQSIKGRKGINQVHMNCLYDILNDLFLDISLQSIHHMDEEGAFCTFLDRERYCDPKQKKIFIADRGYASYNVLAHLFHNDQLFVIRATNCIIKGLCADNRNWLNEPYFDENVVVHIARHKSQEYTKLENFHYQCPSRPYDYLEKGSADVDRLQFRILKFPLSEDSFEYIITNLPSYSFSMARIKELYNLRWNVETAFRHLKYAGNMVHIHSLKQDFLVQEIYGKLTLYNFTAALMAMSAPVHKQNCNYTYVLNHTQIQRICIRFLRGNIREIEEMIARFSVPIRPGRKFPRKLRRQSADTLLYR